MEKEIETGAIYTEQQRSDCIADLKARLEGQVVDVTVPERNDFQSGDFTLIYADGRRVEIRAVGWETDGVVVK